MRVPMRDVSRFVFRIWIVSFSVVTGFGCAHRPYEPINLSAIDENQGGYLIVSDVERDSFGYGIAKAGDINRDGIDDILIGAPGATVNRNQRAGKAYAIFGRENPDSLTLVQGSLDHDTDGYEIRGGEDGAFIGRELASLDDFDGDGIRDLLVGAFGASDHKGKVYLISSTEKLNDIQLRNKDKRRDGVIHVESVQPHGELGSSVSAAGDVNGDGLSDAIVAVHQAKPSGEAYVLFGNQKEQRYDLDAIKRGDGNGFAILGESSPGQLGHVVAGGGDINGDGLSDVVVSDWLGTAAGRERAGVTYVVFGKKDTSPIMAKQISQDKKGGFAIYGESAGDEAGYWLSAGGDINGDGFSDIVIGSPYADVDGVPAGKVYVVFGKATTAPVDLSKLANESAGFVIEGDEPNENFGRVAMAGDINGDGLADLLLSAAGPRGTERARDGRAYIVFGKRDTETIQRIELDRGYSRGIKISGTKQHSLVGLRVIEAGDVNGDGDADVLVSAKVKADENAPWQGGVYVVFGGSDFLRASRIEYAWDLITHLDKRKRKDARTGTEAPPPNFEAERGELILLLGKNGEIMVGPTTSSGENTLYALPTSDGIELYHYGGNWREKYATVTREGRIVMTNIWISLYPARQMSPPFPDLSYPTWKFKSISGALEMIPTGEVIFPSYGAKRMPVRRPRGTIAWLIQLDNDMLFVPRQSIRPPADVLWVLKRNDGLEIVHSGPSAHGLWGKVSIDKSIEFAGEVPNVWIDRAWPHIDDNGFPIISAEGSVIKPSNRIFRPSTLRSN